ncbi:MAG: hypothetical protein GQ533_14550 [Methanosarcinaceae archaeon]|nr:hypothetical protein [Methanosarcinaceae archaeon]
MRWKYYFIVGLVFFGLGTIVGYYIHGDTTFESIVNFIVAGLSIGVGFEVVGILRDWFKERREVREKKREKLEEDLQKHTNDLNKVIELWMKQLPNVSTDKLQGISFGILTGYKEGINPFMDHFVKGTFKNHEIRLTIEDEYIFEDLLFHLEKQEPKISILWNEYKEKCIEQYIEGKELVLEIEKELIGQIGRETDTRQLKITEHGRETNSISEYFLNVIFHACIICVEEEKEEFSKFYEGFESYTGHEDNTILYSISDLRSGYITIEKGLLEEDEFKTKMDNVMMQMFEKAKTDYYPKGKKLVNLTDEISRLRNKLKKHLREQQFYQIFKGNCKYLN